jgi:hypothetical protein
MPGTASFTEKEQYKLIIINKAIAHEITNEHAAKKLQLSLRQIKRLKQQVKLHGEKAIVHKLKGKQSNHHIADDTKTKAVDIIKKSYADFKPILAAEKLEEIHAIPITAQTARIWMTEAGIWKPRRKKKTGEHRSWRPRKEYYGEMEQFDGSYHLWFEDRFVDVLGDPIEVCLLAAIDDAKGEITKAVFAANEGVIAVFTFCKEYVSERGKPRIIYLDKFSTYKINHKSAVDNSELMTQFQRAMQDLGINLIPANSPQAKGRVERLFKTLQDRLIKEMRLAKINTPEAGNIFLRENFIPKFNERFGVIPEKAGDMHVPLTKEDKKNLNRIFSVQSTRVVHNDFTIQFKNTWYQLEEIQPVTIRAKEKVLVEEWLDGTIHLSHKGKYLQYSVLPEKPKKQKQNPIILTQHKLNYKPPQNHPWRTPIKPKP